MTRFFTFLTMFAMSAALVGCSQEDSQVQTPETDNGAAVTSGDTTTSEPVDHSAAKPALPDGEATEDSPETEPKSDGKVEEEPKADE